MTLDAFIRIDGPVTGPYAGQIIFRGDDRGALDPYTLSIIPSGQLQFQVTNASNLSASLVSPAALPMGVYLRVTGSLDDVTGTQRLFVNGTLVASQVTTIRPFSQLSASENPGVGIGNVQSANYSEYFNGVIDEVNIRDDANFGLGAAVSGPVYDAAGDFEQGWTAKSNPNGVWSYGYSSGFTNSITLYDKTAQGVSNGPDAQFWLSSSVNIGSSPAATFNNGPAYADGNVDFLANQFVLVSENGGSGQYSDLVFTAPASGVYSVAASFRGDQRGVGTVVGVAANSAVLFHSTVTGDGQVVTFAGNLSLKAGNTVVFSVGPGGGLQNTGLSATITTATTSPSITSSPSLGEIAFGANVAGTLTATGGKTPYTWSSTGLPAGVTLNAVSGALTGSPSQPGNYSFTAQVSDSQTPPATASLSISLQVLGFTTPAGLPAGATTATYSQTFSAAGGTPPYTFSSPNLPAGLAFTGATVSGTPKTVGSYSITVGVLDATGFSTSSAFRLVVTGPATTLNVSGGALTSGQAGALSFAGFDRFGRGAPYTWAVIGGALPAGLSLNKASGVISGVPQTAGPSLFTAQATDRSSASASAVFTIAITPGPPSISGPSISQRDCRFRLSPADSDGLRRQPPVHIHNHQRYAAARVESKQRWAA